MDEIWKDIIGFEGFYKISNLGNVFSVRSNRNLKPNIKKTGYVYIELNIKGNATCYRIHRLVAEAFIPNPNNKPFVNHINGIKNDNRVENLEWVTGSENNIHAIKNNLVDLKKRSKTYLIYKDGKILKEIKGMENLSELIGYKKSSLGNYIYYGNQLKQGTYKDCIIKVK